MTVIRFGVFSCGGGVFGIMSTEIVLGPIQWLVVFRFVEVNSAVP